MLRVGDHTGCNLFWLNLGSCCSTVGAFFCFVFFVFVSACMLQLHALSSYVLNFMEFLYYVVDHHIVIFEVYIEFSFQDFNAFVKCWRCMWRCLGSIGDGELCVIRIPFLASFLVLQLSLLLISLIFLLELFWIACLWYQNIGIVI